MILQTEADIIDALGGTNQLAMQLNVGASAVSNWRKNGFPQSKYLQLINLCHRRGLAFQPRLFGQTDLGAYADMDENQPAARHYNQFIKQGQYVQQLAAKGFEALSLPILQPADPFISLMGQEMRQRLYTFIAPDGEELCLRPDLTIPTALHYAQAGHQGDKAYCYEGLAFRYQPRGAGKPEEFTQLGIEIIGSGADIAAVLRPIKDMLAIMGVTDYQIVMNDIQLFASLLRVLKMPPHARDILFQAYLNGLDMDDQLDRLCKADEDINTAPREADIAKLSTYGSEEMIFGRSRADIMARLLTKTEQRRQTLSPQIAEIIRFYLSFIDVPVAQLESAFLGELRFLPDIVLAELRQKIHLIANHADIFNPSVGRKMAYYTDLAFEIHSPALPAAQSLAAGGAYHNLLTIIGAKDKTQAMGAAINVERALLAAQVEKVAEEAAEGANNE